MTPTAVIRLESRRRRGRRFAVAGVIGSVLCVGLLLGVEQLHHVAEMTQPLPLPIQVQAAPHLRAPPAPAWRAPTQDQTAQAIATGFAPALPLPDLEPLSAGVATQALPALNLDLTPSVAVPQMETSTLEVPEDRPARLLQALDTERFYPQRARRHQIAGSSLLVLDISAQGQVQNAQVISSEPSGIFDASALALARSLHFAPAQRAGQAVASRMHLRLNWRAEE